MSPDYLLCLPMVSVHSAGESAMVMDETPDFMVANKFGDMR